MHRSSNQDDLIAAPVKQICCQAQGQHGGEPRVMRVFTADNLVHSASDVVLPRSNTQSAVVKTLH